MTKQKVFLITEVSHDKYYLLEHEGTTVITGARGYFESPLEAYEVARGLGFITQDIDGW